MRKLSCLPEESASLSPKAMGAASHGAWTLSKSLGLCVEPHLLTHNSQGTGLSRAKLMGMTLAVGGSGQRNIPIAGG